MLESIRLTKRVAGQDAAVAMGRRLYSEQLARIHWTTPREEKEVFAYLGRHDDQRYSPVDCIELRSTEA